MDFCREVSQRQLCDLPMLSLHFQGEAFINFWLGNCLCSVFINPMSCWSLSLMVEGYVMFQPSITWSLLFLISPFFSDYSLLRVIVFPLIASATHFIRASTALVVYYFWQLRLRRISHVRLRRSRFLLFSTLHSQSVTVNLVMILFDLINICSNFNYFGDYSANQHPQICNIDEKHKKYINRTEQRKTYKQKHIES